MNNSEFKLHNEETLSPISYVGPDEYKNAADQIVSSGGHLFKGYVNIKNPVNLLTATAKTVGKSKPKYFINNVAFSIVNPATGEEHVFETSATMTEKVRDKALEEGVEVLDCEDSYYAYVQHVPKIVDGKPTGGFTFFITLTHYTDAGLITTDIDFGLDQSVATAPAATTAAPVATPGTV